MSSSMFTFYATINNTFTFYETKNITFTLHATIRDISTSNATSRTLALSLSMRYIKNASCGELTCRREAARN